MAVYALQNPGHAGLQLVPTSPPANGDVADAGSGQFLLVVNPAANGTITVTLPCPPNDGVNTASRVCSILQGTSWIIPVPESVYGSSVTITFTGTLTTVQVSLISIPLT